MPTLKEIQEEAHGIPGAPSGQKKKSSKKEETAQTESPESKSPRAAVEKHMRKVMIGKDLKVTIEFLELVTRELNEGEEENTVITNIFKVESKQLPHKDLIDAMKKLRKHGLEICEMEVDSKALTNYNVSCIKISGDVTLRQSRVVMTLAKTIERTGKIVHITTPQTTMYGESDYHKAAEMAKLVESVIAEAWLYIQGKYQEENQLALFAVR